MNPGTQLSEGPLRLCLCPVYIRFVVHDSLSRLLWLPAVMKYYCILLVFLLPPLDYMTVHQICLHFLEFYHRQMVRLVPRIAHYLRSNAYQKALRTPRKTPAYPPRQRKVRGYMPRCPSFAASGRKHSVLLDAPNPIIHSKVFVRRKSRKPAVPLLSLQANEKGKDGSRSRKMNPSELDVWASPYCM